MTFSSTWGQTATHTTTVEASPSPTSTQFTLTNIGNLRVGHIIYVDVSSTAEKTSITGISGSQVTVSPALPGSPDVPGEVTSYSESLTNDKLNLSSIWDAVDLTELANVDTTNMAEGTRATVKDVGIMYRWQPGTDNFADGLTVINGTSGQWIADDGNTQESASGSDSKIRRLMARIKKLEELSTVSCPTMAEIIHEGTYLVGVGDSLAASSEVSTPVNVVTQQNDRIIATPLYLPAGLGYFVFSMENRLFIRIRNFTGSAVLVGAIPFKITIVRAPYYAE